MAWFRVFLFAWCILLWPLQAAANIGTVIGVKQGADILRGGKSQTVRPGMDVASGDAISTDGSGLVQMVFTDGTKIAIGPNATMVLDVAMLRGNRKAKSFAVQALGGSFRFISGNSRKKAYSIRTPTATMAVRGTIFDLWVVSGTQSAMVVLDGRVQMCGLSGSCQSTGRQCSMFATTSRGAVGQPADQEQYANALRNGFPFVVSQEALLAPLQVDLGGCARQAVPIKIKQSDAPAPRRTRPQRAVVAAASAPNKPPAPEPPDPDKPAPKPPEPDPPEPEPPAPEPKGKPNRSGHQDGSHPGGQTKNQGGYDNPGKGKTNRSGQGDATNRGGRSRNAGGSNNPGKGAVNNPGGQKGARSRGKSNSMKNSGTAGNGKG